MGRRQRHFNPKDAGALLAVDARFITGLSSGTGVQTWSSRAGLTTSVIQNNSNLRPTYQTNIKGGNPIVRFDSSSQGMAGLFSYTVTSQTVILIFSSTMAGAWSRWFTQSDGVSTDFALAGHYIPLLRNGSNNQLASYAASSSQATLSYSGGWVIASAVHTGSQFNNFLNGVASANGSSTLNRTFAVCGFGVGFSGAADGFAGDAASCMMFTTNLSASLRRRLEHASALAFKIASS